MLNFVQVLAAYKTTRHTHTHTQKKGHATGCLFLKAGVCLSTPFFPLLSPHPSALCLFVLRLLCLFPSSWAAAAAAELANISLHFNTLLLPRPHTAIAYPSQSKKQQPSGRWKFFFAFPRCLAKSAKKRKTFSAQWIFAHFPPVWASYSLPSHSSSESIRAACEKFPFSIFPIFLAFALPPSWQQKSLRSANYANSRQIPWLMPWQITQQCGNSGRQYSPPIPPSLLAEIKN